MKTALYTGVRAVALKHLKHNLVKKQCYLPVLINNALYDKATSSVRASVRTALPNLTSISLAVKVSISFQKEL